MKLYKSGSTSLKVTDGTLLTPTALVVTVAAATAAKFTLAASATSLAAGGSVQPHDHRPGCLRQHGHLLHRRQEPHLLRGLGQPGATNRPSPTASGTATAFGTATAITFTAGVAAISSAPKTA